MISPLSEYPLGGLSARYLQDTETGAVELQLLPAGCTSPPDARRCHADSLVQAYLTGDELPGGYSGGLADSESGQWCKTLAPGETFVSPTALLTAVQTDSLDEAAAPMVEWDQNHLPPELPLVFNEYCSSWGSPSQESVERLVNAVRGHGFRYFVIDCGWYKAEGVPWDTFMGDYDVSPVLFPAGQAWCRGSGLSRRLWATTPGPLAAPGTSSTAGAPC